MVPQVQDRVGLGREVDVVAARARSRRREGKTSILGQCLDFSFAPEADGRPVANRVQGGKRPRSSMSPLLVFAQPTGQPVLSAGSPGGAMIIHFTAQSLWGMLHWIVIGSLLVILLSLLVAPLLQKMARLDGATTLYAVSLGGAAEMSMQAQEMGADAPMVALSHTLRIVLVTLCTSLIAGASGIALPNSAPPAPHVSVASAACSCAAISAASILAKSARDRELVALAKAYPEYAFERHKGYATQLHLAKIREFGALERPFSGKIDLRVLKIRGILEDWKKIKHAA